MHRNDRAGAVFGDGMTRAPRLAAFVAVALASVVAMPRPSTAQGDYYQRDDEYYGDDRAPGYTSDYDDADYDDAPEYVDNAPDPSRYDEALAPYGHWLDDPTYGRVWQPSVDADWRPYSNGRWVWTSAGWTWVAEEPWGWTFHYGRWVQDPELGWVWVPGTEWSPAWVDWYEEDGYVGWAPLGFAAAPIGFSAFVFVPFDHFCSRHVHHFFVPHQRLPFRHLGPGGHWRAPERRAIEDRMHERVPRMRLREADVPRGRGFDDRRDRRVDRGAGDRGGRDWRGGSDWNARHDWRGRDVRRGSIDERDRRGFERGIPVAPRGGTDRTGGVIMPREGDVRGGDLRGAPRDMGRRGSTGSVVAPRGGTDRTGGGMVAPRGNVSGPSGTRGDVGAAGAGIVGPRGGISGPGTMSGFGGGRGGMMGGGGWGGGRR